MSTVPGDQATFTFTGTSVRWIGYRGPGAGIARVILDGTVVKDSLDLFIPTEGPQEAVFTSPVLAAGSHTLTIQVMGSKNLASTGIAIVVDAFDVSP
jgi:energy-converting hydrogenase Eha subunit A